MLRKGISRKVAKDAEDAVVTSSCSPRALGVVSFALPQLWKGRGVSRVSRKDAKDAKGGNEGVKHLTNVNQRMLVFSVVCQ
jgi:hypothetical protein